MSVSLSRLRRTSPPSLTPKTAMPLQSEAPVALAAKEKKDKFGWGKFALGLGLATTALTACGSPTPPAADPGAYEIESPELVVMSDSIQRVDLARETETDCIGTGEDRRCTTEDVVYHPVGIHIGEGVVQDLNGNLFAAPQLVTDSPGIAVSNPTSLDLEVKWSSDGSLRTKEDGSIELRGRFGKSKVEISENEVAVDSQGFLGGRITSVTHSDGVSKVKEGSHQTVALVQSQGDHVLVQTKHGREIAEIRHDEDNNQYVIDRGSGFGNTETTFTYDGNEMTRKNGRWNGNAVVRETNPQGEVVFKEKSGRHTVVTTTVGENGWTDEGGFLSSDFHYTYEGGEVLPG